jgi:hypothetical protein
MTEPSTPPSIDLQKVRIGYAFIGVVMVVSLILAVVLSNWSARLVFALVFVFGGYRLFKLNRSLRQPPPPR